MTTVPTTGEKGDEGLARSRRIAAYLGPILVILAVSEAKNLAIWNEANPALTYLAGLLWFTGGLAVVTVHNRWSRTWPIAITLAGWFFLIGGVFRLLFPGAQQGNANTPALAVYALDGVLAAAGVLLTVRAHRPAGRRPARLQPAHRLPAG